MEIRVTGRKIDVGNALRAHIRIRLETIVEKYFSRSIESQVTVGKQGHLFAVDCTLHMRQGIHLKSSGEAADAHAAFEIAADRIEKQLRRHKRRLKDHHAIGRAEQGEVVALMAQAYVLAAQDSDEDETSGSTAAASDEQPVIIAETRTEIPHVSVGDAVMLMDLANVPALMFRNCRNDQFNVVYRRPDGNIGWIDPAENKAGGGS